MNEINQALQQQMTDYAPRVAIRWLGAFEDALASSDATRIGALFHEDSHWRDVHGPLALEHHKYMSHYTQLSVVGNLTGLVLDGFALCGFESLDDLRNRFYSGPESPEIIAADVRRFADLKNSPARLIAKEFRY